MFKVPERVGRQRFLITVLVIYFILGLAMLGWFRHQLNPDAVSYISIARHYAAGDFHDALNAYWGPLLSWLLVPFALLHLSMQTGAKLVALLTGGIIISLVWLLAGQLGLEWRTRRLITVIMVPLVWYWALPSPITPDMLVVGIFLIYLSALITNFRRDFSGPILIGALGALGFFAKAFFLPSFVIHFLVWTYLKWRGALAGRRRSVLLNAGLSLLVTALLILPWAIGLGLKYHRFIISSSGSYNIATMSPEQPGQPMSYLGLLPTPSSGALSSWEDPSSIPTSGWTPFQSLHDFHFYLGILVENIRVIGLLLLTFSVFSLAILAWGAGLRMSERSKPRRVKLDLLLSAVLIYALGYSLIVREERYFWPIFVAIILLCGLISSGYLKRKPWRPALSFAVVVVTISFIFLPLAKLNNQRNVDLGVKESADSLAGYVKPGSRVASNTFNSIKYCYYWQAQCYGAFKPGASTAFNEQQLKQYKITAVLILTGGNPGPKPAYLAVYHYQLTGDAATQLYLLN